MSFLVPLRPSALNQRHRAWIPALVPAFVPTYGWGASARRPLATLNFKVYESKGDYRADAEVLENPSLPLYSVQDSIPVLPVPSLEDTCQRFLPTALPLASNAAEAASLQEAVAKFPAQASTLQQRLLQRAEEHSSWLQHWWNTLGYLQVRDPIVVHVSYFFRCDDDPILERLLQEPQHDTTIKSYQPCVARSAALLPVAIQYAQSMLANQTEPATLGRGDKQVTLCSAQNKYMFQACRIPRIGSDIYRMYYQPKSLQHQQQPQHIVIACRGQFFAVNVDQPMSQRQWRQILHHCIEQTKQPQNLAPSLGWLTGLNRDKWSAAHELILQQGGTLLRDALTCLESSLFMICLDVDEEIRTDRDRALQFWHGRSDDASDDYHNRWHDKSAAIIVTQNGKLGFQGEHSMLDGMPFVDFCDTMVHKGTVDDDCLVADSDDNELPCHATNVFQEAFSSLTPTARAHIDRCLASARQDFLSLTNEYELHTQHYRTYGSNVMKRARCSPDAYIQMAMQLASYRMFGEPLATYESTQVRRFLHGRTETTRTVSPASLAFCKAMSPTFSRGGNDVGTQTREHCYKLLQEACNSHVNYIRNAVQAQGVDRHFFGLSMFTTEDDDKPDLFAHPLFAKSKRFRLSTSSLPNMAVGFGPVVADGLGLGYEAKPNSCIIHVTARKEHGWTEAFCEHLGQALDDMRTLYDVEEDHDSPPRTKL